MIHILINCMSLKLSIRAINRNIMLFLFLSVLEGLSHAATSINTNQTDSLFNIVKMSTILSKDSLMSPYNYLLTQPLMTTTLERYYKRTSRIKVIAAFTNPDNNTYYRIIIMYVDRNKKRNNVDLAQKKNEVIPVELAAIKINFDELPEKLITDIIYTNIPFGKLLTQHHLKVFSKDRTYFSLACNKMLASLIHCKPNKKLYGRTNLLVRADNEKWIARVIEILSDEKEIKHYLKSN
ncbi:hypothetical protein OQJ02_07320 [Legionella sp. PATHC032]|uniref:hypothetical protein n=1 Tax=Legionella sp. PATHC032 TaxID=2992039 RepID=UPI001B0F5179|nr:hypothetical protein [Legionella sp. PATHC032]MCW8421446.1 hypothetical protein [Legionella sp. PATHC032]HAZ7572617.1 hypothetical protein [Legionella pneumophila]HBA1633971.1 hypothetical protein [Legionella pneumophila]